MPLPLAVTQRYLVLQLSVTLTPLQHLEALQKMQEPCSCGRPYSIEEASRVQLRRSKQIDHHELQS